MPDKTTIGISDLLRQFIEALAEEVVLEGKPFADQKKWLRKYSENEGVNYAALEKNLTEFFETIEELKSHESKAGERLAKLLAKDCFLDEGKVNELVSAVNELREGVEQRASEEAKCEAQKKTVNTAAIQGFVNGHEYVDLGLPSGTLWATCNIGSTMPEESGDYFAWGETQPKSNYSENTYKFFNGNSYTKYTNSNRFKVLELCDDVADVKWGVGWRMPTKEEWEELVNNTTHRWRKRKGVYGSLITASNGNSFFLPAAGHKWDDKVSEKGHEGWYWSASRMSSWDNVWISAEGGAYRTFINPYNFCCHSYSKTFIGGSIRPVINTNPFTYMKSRGGDIFNEMPGGHLLKEKTLDKLTV